MTDHEAGRSETNGSLEGSGAGHTDDRWPRPNRRSVLGLLTTSIATGIAGCSGGSADTDADVVAGPDGRNVFEPAALTVDVGDTVTWLFESGGHNLCCRPVDHDAVELPQNAEPFSTYAPDEDPERALVPRSGTYEQTLDGPGTYRYVCIPHASIGMQGVIRVE